MKNVIGGFSSLAFTPLRLFTFLCAYSTNQSVSKSQQKLNTNRRAYQKNETLTCSLMHIQQQQNMNFLSD